VRARASQAHSGLSQEERALLARAATTRFFLLHELGPTHFVLRGEASGETFRVLVGAAQRCSCAEGSTRGPRAPRLCAHIVFVMTKVLRVPVDHPLAWQHSLLDVEVAQILRERLARSSGSEAAVARAPRRVGAAVKPVAPHAGDVCAICQEALLDGEAPTTALAHCPQGCGRATHARCLLLWADHRQAMGEAAPCPLCRCEWPRLRLLELRRREGGSGGAESESVSSAPPRPRERAFCSRCRTLLRSERLRCAECRDFDLCAQCFRAAGRHERSHAFVRAQREASDLAWGPWTTPPQAALQRRGELMAELQRRELSEADYELLLQLETHASTQSAPDYLAERVLQRGAMLPPAAACAFCLEALDATVPMAGVLRCGHAAHLQCVAHRLREDMSAACSACKEAAKRAQTSEAPSGGDSPRASPSSSPPVSEPLLPGLHPDNLRPKHFARPAQAAPAPPSHSRRAAASASVAATAQAATRAAEAIELFVRGQASGAALGRAALSEAPADRSSVNQRETPTTHRSRESEAAPRRSDTIFSFATPPPPPPPPAETQDTIAGRLSLPSLSRRGAEALRRAAVQRRKVAQAGHEPQLAPLSLKPPPASDAALPRVPGMAGRVRAARYRGSTAAFSRFLSELEGETVQ
jgi:E3 ubiquitin-protein ligase ZSWIM2